MSPELLRPSVTSVPPKGVFSLLDKSVFNRNEVDPTSASVKIT